MKRAVSFSLILSCLVGVLAWSQPAPGDAAELTFPRDGIAGFREVHSGTVEGLWALDSQGLLGSIPNDSVFSFFVGPTSLATQTASVSSTFRFVRSVDYNAAGVGIVSSSSIHRSITHLHCEISAREDWMLMRGGLNGSGDLAGITSQRLGRDIQLNVPYKLTLEVDGPTARCLLDDQPVLSSAVRDLSSFPAQMNPALFVIEAEARFANLVTGGPGTQAPPPTAGIFGTNLIVNGNAEASAESTSGLTVVPVPGWTTVGTFTTIQYAAGGGFPTSQDPGPPDRGANFFGGGPSSPSSSASQVIDVSAGAATIDADGVTFNLSGYLGGFSGQGDNAGLTATFRGASGNSLGAATLGPVTAADRGGQTGMVLRTRSGNLPAGTRRIDVQLQMTRTEGDSNDGYADSLSLVLTTPTSPPTAGVPIVVPGTANIFAAGLTSVPSFSGGGGTLPPSVDVAGVGTVTVSATGLTNCCSSTPDTPPEGGNPFGETNITSLGGISGIRAPKELMLVGVFLGPGAPAGPAPRSLDFVTSGTDFTTLAPALQQVFVIGDGQTSRGVPQSFTLPSGATRLFLGFADAFAFSGSPAAYDDNTGSLTVTVTPGAAVAPTPPSGGATLQITANSTSVRAGDRLVVTLNTSPLPDGAVVDLYAAVRLAGGSVLFFTGNPFNPFSVEPAVFRRALTVTQTSFEALNIVLPDGVPPGTYTFLAAYIRQGRPPTIIDVVGQLAQLNVTIGSR